MPSVTQLAHFQEERIQAAMQRRDRRMERVVLPPDFTGQIFSKCREESNKILNRVAFLNGEKAHIVERIKFLENEARTMMPQIVHSKLTGNIFSKFEVVTVHDQNCRVKTKAVVDFRTAKIDPLRRQQNRLEQEIFIRNQEHGQLKRIARACGAGDVGLLCMLTDAWRNRLEIGGAVFGKLPEPVRLLGVKNTIYVDPAGNPLPAEMLDQSGKPDMPTGEDPKMPGRGGGWRGDHPEALPGQPADRNATFDKPVQAR